MEVLHKEDSHVNEDNTDVEISPKVVTNNPTLVLANSHSKNSSKEDCDGNTEKGEESANIAKAKRFWNHPSLRHLPTEHKFAYLHRKGVSDDEIHKAWDQIVSSEEDAVVKKTDEIHPTTIALQNATNSVLQQNQQQPVVFAAQNKGASVPLNGNLPLSTQQKPGVAGHYSQQSQQYNGSGGMGGGLYSNNNTNNNPYPNDPYYHQQHQPGYNNNGPLLDEESSQSMTMAQGVSLVTMGGMLGLTAAAAARWLNGGDFQLFPSPTNQDIAQQTTADRQRRSESSAFSDDDDDDNDNDEEVDEDEEDFEEEENVEEEYEAFREGFSPSSSPQQNDQIIEKLERISDTFQNYVKIQEQILQKVSTQNNSSITNSSMDFLRSNSRVNIDKEENGNKSNAANGGDLINILIQLVEIKSELRRLDTTASSSSMSIKNGSKPLEASLQLSKSIAKLDSCLDMIVGTLETKSTTGNGIKVVDDSKMTTATKTLGDDPTNKKKSIPSLSLSQNNDNTTEESSSTVIIETSDRTTDATLNEIIEDPQIAGSQSEQQEQQESGAQEKTTTPLSSQSSQSGLAIEDSSPNTEAVATKTDEATTTNSTTMTTTDSTESLTLNQAVEVLASENDPTAVRIGCQILYLYFVNLSNKPNNTRYRKIYTTNESYQKIVNLKGAMDLLKYVGFQQDETGSCLEWLPPPGDDLDSDDDHQKQKELMFLPKLKQGISILGILKAGKPNMKDKALAALSSAV